MHSACNVFSNTGLPMRRKRSFAGEDKIVDQLRPVRRLYTRRLMRYEGGARYLLRSGSLPGTASARSAQQRANKTLVKIRIRGQSFATQIFSSRKSVYLSAAKTFLLINRRIRRRLWLFRVVGRRLDCPHEE